MKALVTGASGRFAPHLIRELSSHGHEVVLFSRKRPDDEFKDYEWVAGDINDYESCYAAIHKKGFDAIQNTAAKPHPTDTPGSPKYDDPAFFPLTMQTNIIGLYNLLQAAIRSDVGTFVHTGSNCALGHGFRFSGRPFEIKYLPIDEAHPTDGEDSYSFSKLVGEQLMESYAKAYGIRCYSLRSAGITNAARRAEMKSGTKPITGWSEWMFPWIASEDLASAHRLLMEQAASIVPFGAYYCNNDDTHILEPTMEVINKYRPDLVPLIREPLEGHATLFSNKRLKAVVGWKPQQSWR
ncbi:MAG: NAD(P)-dependent oxidoreductase [Clostridiales bacterium]|jgi:nucleoside-diphosphate-sugar epimerase|nr:NAD(P)-dependent oxidoreductase [Clostridiales bacterium]